MKTTGIVGGSGFIGSYNTKKFLAEGYRVKTSVTDLSKKEKYEHLLQLPNKNYLHSSKNYPVSDISLMLNNILLTKWLAPKESLRDKWDSSSIAV